MGLRHNCLGFHMFFLRSCWRRWIGRLRYCRSKWCKLWCWLHLSVQAKSVVSYVFQANDSGSLCRPMASEPRHKLGFCQLGSHSLHRLHNSIQCRKVSSLPRQIQSHLVTRYFSCFIKTLHFTQKYSALSVSCGDPVLWRRRLLKQQWPSRHY